MTSANAFLSKLNQIDVESSALIAMEQTADAAADAQRSQLAQGLDKNEDFIINQITGLDYYSKDYARYKGKSGPIDLRDHGDYYAGIGMDLRNDGSFVMFSADEKGPMLNDTYNALGLGRSARVSWIKELKPELLKITFRPIRK
jgi:hypothetical protein